MLLTAQSDGNYNTAVTRGADPHAHPCRPVESACETKRTCRRASGVPLDMPGDENADAAASIAGEPSVCARCI